MLLLLLEKLLIVPDDLDGVDAEEGQGSAHVEGRQADGLGCANEEEVHDGGALSVRPETLGNLLNVLEILYSCEYCDKVEGDQVKDAFPVFGIALVLGKHESIH